MNCKQCQTPLTPENTCCEGGMKCKNCAPACNKDGEGGKCNCGCME